MGIVQRFHYAWSGFSHEFRVNPVPLPRKAPPSRAAVAAAAREGGGDAERGYVSEKLSA